MYFVTHCNKNLFVAFPTTYKRLIFKFNIVIKEIEKKYDFCVLNVTTNRIYKFR